MMLIIFGIALLLLVYIKLRKTHNFWIERGVKQRKQIYLLGDNAGVILQRETFFDMMQNLYNAYPEERYMGMYQMTLPTLVIRDPDLIKQITVKEFDHFVDHRPFIPDGVDPIWSKNLFALKGNEWRNMRATLSPSFTSSKMRAIFNLISICAHEYMDYFTKTQGTQTVELKDTFTRYTNDVIASTAFGLKSDSINEKDNEFYLNGKEITTFTFWKNMRFFLYTLTPRLSAALKIKLFPDHLTNFFKNIIMSTIKAREEQGIVRPDMIHLLLEARKGKKKFEVPPVLDTGFSTVEETIKPVQQTYQITDTDIAAQALIFFFAGFETVSIAMCFMGYELTVNPDIQERLQKEIDETIESCEGTLTYEALMKMKYMDMVVSETLRKWPPAVGSDRVCNETFTIEPKNPGEKAITLQKGDIIWFPTNAIQRDPKYYPNPDKFDPERFSDENKHNIKPYTYLPFGLGPRNCIGSRFALLELKTIFFHLLRNFDLVVTEKTQIPLKLSKKSFNMIAENGMWIGLKPRCL
nr:cytochrome P450 9e2-like [Onthophagus taurus]XP_022908459.1 cytochrome P450 9e2-like [Onthophagus taurus]